MTAFLFPGQGSQQSGMLSADNLCPQTLREAQEFLASRPDRVSLAALDSLDHLSHGQDAQLALLIVGVAAARTLTRDWGVPAPEVVAGHSVGAFSAAVVAGALTFAEALDVVATRADAMEAVCAQGVWGMSAVLGIDSRTAADVAGQVGTPQDPLWVANINSRNQVVFSGTVSALEALVPAALHVGASRVESLAVNVAAHCPLQEPVRDTLVHALACVPARPLRAAYLTNTGGRRVQTSAEVLADLAESVALPVQWRTIAEILPELGVVRAVEMPPGHTLTRLTDSPRMHVLAAADIGLRGIANRLSGPST